MLKKLRELHKNSTGFTIIEIMIVLTVAGLIILIVFLAVPQLQRNQRNQRRKDVTNRIKAEVENYASNNNGSLPTADANAATGFNTGGGFPGRYLSNVNYNDPKTNAAMTLATWTSDASVNTQATIYYVLGRTCNGEASQGASAANYVMMLQLEGGAIYCVDNK